ncbi:hypothetical protein THRCLA_11879 [Thraustotheca clavata]|uniref:Uncharacterized protein n=1 Tax=Thraustotheca clavata TaxID=74557 RepID=A0A1V9Y5U4_9STRA|nr:hypothetical protein THRCLA_11879 [Thraustotheca clavata]
MNRLLQSFVSPSPAPSTAFTAPPPVDEAQYEEVDLNASSSSRSASEFFSLESKSPLIRNMGRNTDYGPRSNDSASFSQPSTSSLFAQQTAMSTQASYGSTSSLTSSAASLFEHEAPSDGFGAGNHQQYSSQNQYSHEPPREAASLFGEPPQATTNSFYQTPAFEHSTPASPPREAALLFGESTSSNPFAQPNEQYHQPTSDMFGQSNQPFSQPSSDMFGHHSNQQYNQHSNASPKPQEAASLFGNTTHSEPSFENSTSHNQFAAPVHEISSSLFNQQPPTDSFSYQSTPAIVQNSTENSVLQPTPSPELYPSSSPVHQPTPSPLNKPAPSPVYKSSPSPVQKPAASPVQRPAPSPVQKPAPSPVYKPNPSPTQRTLPSPLKVPTQLPMQKPTQSPVQQTSSSPVPKPTPSPLQTPPKSPMKNSLPSPAPKPVTQDSPIPFGDNSAANLFQQSPMQDNSGPNHEEQSASDPFYEQQQYRQYEGNNYSTYQQYPPQQRPLQQSNYYTQPNNSYQGGFEQEPLQSNYPANNNAPFKAAPAPPQNTRSLPATRLRPKLNLSSMEKLSVSETPSQMPSFPLPPRSNSRYVPLSPANSIRSDVSASHASMMNLVRQYKSMAERLEKEKSELLEILTQQAEQFYAMQAYIEQLQAERNN